MYTGLIETIKKAKKMSVCMKVAIFITGRLGIKISIQYIK